MFLCYLNRDAISISVSRLWKRIWKDSRF